VLRVCGLDKLDQPEWGSTSRNGARPAGMGLDQPEWGSPGGNGGLDKLAWRVCGLDKLDQPVQ